MGGSAVAGTEPVEVVNGAVAASNWPGSAYCAGDVILGGSYRHRVPAARARCRRPRADANVQPVPCVLAV